ncbi:MAG: M14 family metallocarboxypeptidase [Clostridia bacterium]|nr:M14 family metallocarboxypeptidase [Clostridia bacterium]
MKKDIAYTHEQLKKDMSHLARNFHELEWGSIGKSVWGKELFYIRLGRGETKISFNGAHHGMEWITAQLLMKFAADFLEAEKKNAGFGGFLPRALSRKTSLYIVPMVNPDGVELATMGLPEQLSAELKNQLIKFNGSKNFERWQANARGVDLNHNYDGMWEMSKKMEKEYGILGPGPTRYSGGVPFSEPESRALVRFTREHNFKMTIAFHSQGKVIYHGFQKKEPPISLKIAKAFEKISPYRIDQTEGIASYGGYKDWFVEEFRRVGFTIEVGEGQNPLPLSQFPKIYRETLPILLGAMTVGL